MVKSKSRYVLLEISSPSDERLSFTPTKLFATIAEKVGDFHGDYGFAICRSGLAVKAIDGDVALLRIDAQSEKFVTSVIPFITNVDGDEVVLRSLIVGRSIRSCEKFLIKYRRSELLGMLKTAGSGVEKNAVLRALRGISANLENADKTKTNQRTSSKC